MKLAFIKRNIATFALIALVLVTSHTQIVQAVDSVVDGNIVFTGPSVEGSRDIHTSTNDGGLRFYSSAALTNPPEGAAIQFYGNDRNVFNGQVYIDSGANNNAAIIFRTAGTSQGVAERMRVTSDGRVGIGTSSPRSTLHVAGNYIQIPTTASEPPATDCNEVGEVGRIVIQQASPHAIWACVSVGFVVSWVSVELSS